MNTFVADQRILRGTAATIESRKLDGNGEPVAASGAVTVVVTAADGTSVLASSAATADATTTGRFTRALTAAQNSTLNLLTCVWTDAGDSTSWTTYVEVVGGFFFSLGEARKSDKSLADVAKYPDADLLEKRREVEDEFEEICGVAFVPRYARVTIDGSGSYTLLAPHARVRTVRSLRAYSDVSAATYTAYTATELADLVVDDAGILRRSSGTAITWGVGNTVLEYEHGFDSVPATIKTAALTRLRHKLNANKSGIPDRASSYVADGGGTFSLAREDAWKTGIDSVDGPLGRYRSMYWTPGMA